MHPVRKVFALLVTLWVAFAFHVEAGAFPRTVVDGTGKEILLEEPPSRIFSTGLAMDNILLSLVEPDRVIGVTRFAADPSMSYVADRVQDHMTQIDVLNAEQVIAAQPDIVLVASWNDQDVVRQLLDFGLDVYTFAHFSSVRDALDNILRMGEITGEDDKAQALVDGFYERYGRIAAKIAGRPRPTVLSWGSWGSTTGLGTSMHDIIEMAGGINLAAERGIQGWKEIDAEAVIEMDPQVIVTESGEDFVRQVLEDEALQGVRAVREGRVYAIPHAGALNHHYIEAIEALAGKLHPEAFE